MTIAEFDALPEAEPFYYELRNGELVEVPRPKHGHYCLQRQLRVLLESSARGAGVVTTGLRFRALPEYEFRVAHFAYVSRERWERIDPEDNLRGAPDLVVEIVAPWDTVYNLYDKEKLCLENGSREFWVLDPKLRQVKVSTPDGITITYRDGQEIPLRLFGSATLAVNAIFS
jgi:Uma2 family endonuclease